MNDSTSAQWTCREEGSHSHWLDPRWRCSWPLVHCHNRSRVSVMEFYSSLGIHHPPAFSCPSSPGSTFSDHAGRAKTKKFLIVFNVFRSTQWVGLESSSKCFMGIEDHFCSMSLFVGAGPLSPFSSPVVPRSSAIHFEKQISPRTETQMWPCCNVAIIPFTVVIFTHSTLHHLYFPPGVGCSIYNVFYHPFFLPSFLSFYSVLIGVSVWWLWKTNVPELHLPFISPMKKKVIC